MVLVLACAAAACTSTGREEMTAARSPDVAVLPGSEVALVASEAVRATAAGNGHFTLGVTISDEDELHDARLRGAFDGGATAVELGDPSSPTVVALTPAGPAIRAPEALEVLGAAIDLPGAAEWITLGDDALGRSLGLGEMQQWAGLAVIPRLVDVADLLADVTEVQVTTATDRDGSERTTYRAAVPAATLFDVLGGRALGLPADEVAIAAIEPTLVATTATVAVTVDGTTARRVDIDFSWPDPPLQDCPAVRATAHVHRISFEFSDLGGLVEVPTPAEGTTVALGDLLRGGAAELGVPDTDVDPILDAVTGWIQDAGSAATDAVVQGCAP